MPTSASSANSLTAHPIGKPLQGLKDQKKAKKEGIVLLNFGGPRSLAETEIFIRGIFTDPNTIQLPLPQWLQNRIAWLVAYLRTPEVREQYAEIGGYSPIFQATNQVAADLSKQLHTRGYSWPLFVVHRYLPQQAKESVQQLVEAGIQRIHALTMQPQFSWATTGSSLEQLTQLLHTFGWNGKLTAQRSYPTETLYIDAMEDKLRTTLKQAQLKPAGTLILCSAHGLPRSYVDKGDPYRLDTQATLEALQARLPEWQFQLSFQSKVGPLEWLKPYTDVIIDTLPAQGIRNLVFVPLSFVNDHIETLYEVGTTYCNQARKAGMNAFRVDAIENHPRFIEWLVESSVRGLRGQGGIPPEELLPPSQYFQRIGWWCWTLWGIAIFSSLLLALT